MSSSSLALRKAAAMLFAVFFVTGCAISLVPDYDAAVVDGLQRTHEKTMILFTSITSGEQKDGTAAAPEEVIRKRGVPVPREEVTRRSKATFQTHTKAYDEIIGAFAALKTRADVRITPPLGQKIVARFAEKGWLKDLCGASDEATSSCVNPTPKIIGQIINNMSRMRDTHRDKGLAHDGRSIFQATYLTAIEQALTVETALKRE